VDDLPVELVVFDCDGVLVDSERISVRVGRALLADLGWALSEREFVERFVGCSQEHFDREVAKGLGRVLEPGWDAGFAEAYQAAYDVELTAVAGVEAVLDRLDAHGVPYCVASNAEHDHIRRSLRRTGLLDRFGERVFSARDVHRGKPDPDLFLLAAAHLDVPPEGCAVVEDSPFGIRAARSAGMACFGYGGGVVPAERLAGLGAVIFDDMRELPGLLGLGAGRPAGRR
jgi:HAD superfamily hydrolase (TIGR01509 family)